MTVLFVARPSKTHLTRASLQCRVSVNGQRGTCFSVGMTFNRADWNPRLQQFKGRSDRAQTDNTTLERVRTKLITIYQYYDTAGIGVTPEKIIETYKGKRVVEITIPNLVHEFLQCEKKRIGPKPGQIIIETYLIKKRRLNALLSFLAACGHKNLLARDMTTAVLTQWINQMEGTYKRNYIAKHIDATQELLNFAVRHEHVQANKLHGFAYAREKPPRPIYLTLDEIARIEALDPARHDLLRPHGQYIYEVRDMLLMLCAIGMHHCDYVELTDHDLRTLDGRQYIVIERRKSGVEAIIPLLPTAQRIVARYGSIGKLPRPKNATANRLLKLIASTCQIDKPISTKYGRRSFTDYFLNVMDWPLPKLLKMLGLTSAQYLAHYGTIDHRSLRLEAETVNA
jgi:site-specific recombinase XerD